MRRLNQHKAMIFVMVTTVAGCDSGQKKSSNFQNVDNTEATTLRQHLINSGVLMPGASGEIVDAAQVSRDEQSTRKTPGDRGVFNSIHHQDQITLLPHRASSLNLATSDDTISVVKDPSVITDDPNGGTCPQRQNICVQACATARAEAVAFAFAHASATACAWAEAWACVFTVAPFTRVCAWSRSQACASAFASAFAAGYASNTETVCARQCSK